MNRLIPYYRARYYSPQIGRFLSRDPLGFILMMGGATTPRGSAELSQGPNLYEYVWDNPTNKVDPLGLQQILPSGPISLPSDALLMDNSTLPSNSNQDTRLKPRNPDDPNVPCPPMTPGSGPYPAPTPPPPTPRSLADTLELVGLDLDALGVSLFFTDIAAGGLDVPGDVLTGVVGVGGLASGGAGYALNHM